MAPTRAVRLLAVGIWVLAALRLPPLIFVSYYVAQGIEIGQRSSDFPDGAFEVWLYFAISDVDNVLLVPLSWLIDSGIGWTRGLSWLLGYSLVTALYVLAGAWLWRGRPLRAGAYRGAVAYLLLSGCVHIVTLIAVIPGAMSAVRSGENAPVSPYRGATLVHACEWILVPWSLASLAGAFVLLGLLRTRSLRSAFGVRTTNFSRT